MNVFTPLSSPSFSSLYLHYSSCPPHNLQSSNSMRIIPTSSTMEMFGFHYMEGLQVPFSLSDVVDLSSLLTRRPFHYFPLRPPSILSTAANIQMNIQKTIDNFIIAKIDNNVGYGLFARRDINRGEVMCMYSGRVTESVPSKGGYLCYGIDSSLIGGVGRFLQHLPFEMNEFFKYSFWKINNAKFTEWEMNWPEGEGKLRMSEDWRRRKRDDLKVSMNEYNRNENDNFDFESIRMERSPPSSIATANLTMVRTSLFPYNYLDDVHITNNSFDVFPSDVSNLIVLVAIRPIKQYEILGFDYGPQYWRSDDIKKMAPRGPTLFDIWGNTIDAMEWGIDYKLNH